MSSKTKTAVVSAPITIKDKTCPKCEKMYAGAYPTCYDCKSTKKCELCPKTILEKYKFCFECNNLKLDVPKVSKYDKNKPPKQQKPLLPTVGSNSVIVELPKRDIINGFLNKKDHPICYRCLKYTTDSYYYLQGQYSHRKYTDQDDTDDVFFHTNCHNPNETILTILDEFQFKVLREESFELVEA
jgi:hypothetical protein